MLKDIVGGMSILYFLYSAYLMFVMSGIWAVLTIIYILPFLLLGVFLIQGENRILSILSGVAIIFLQAYTSGYDISAMVSLLMSPLSILVYIVIPVAGIYCAITEM